ncbi:MAG: hypothetical protein BWY23_02590 [Spirochaetes bacterium ADurb.Bin218]|jgi:hypothetical protein|nr:MAG: hypothetical protein BWY23_02590 [Spirochaetes bacterium ADurb.Bin218]
MKRAEKQDFTRKYEEKIVYASVIPEIGCLCREIINEI